MPYREHQGEVIRVQIPVKRHITGPSAGNHQFAQIVFHPPADQRMPLEDGQTVKDDVADCQRGCRVIADKE